MHRKIVTNSFRRSVFHKQMTNASVSLSYERPGIITNGSEVLEKYAHATV